MKKIKSIIIALGLSFTAASSADNAYKAYQLGDYNQAFQALKAQGDKQALSQYYLARMSLYGYGQLRNEKEALKYFTQAANQGNLSAQLFLARHALQKTKDAAEALKWFKKAADQENLEAKLYVAGAYLFGYGTRRNEDRARHYYIDAAKDGNALAQYALGKNFLKSRYSSNRRLGLIWLKKSANEGGNPKAQMMMGSIYQSGKHVKSDSAQAMDYYQQAAAQQYRPAMLALAEIYEKKGEDSQAERWYQKAAEKNDPKAVTAWANFYLNDKNSLQDKAQGFNMMLKAAQLGSVKAQEALASLYKKGIGVGASDQLSEQWQKKAKASKKAEKSTESARNKLSLWLSVGQIKDFKIPGYQLTGILSPWSDRQALQQNIYNASPKIETFSKADFFKPKFELIQPNEIPLTVYYDALIRLSRDSSHHDWRYPVYPLSRHLQDQLVASSKVVRYHERPLPYEVIYALPKDEVDQPNSLFDQWFGDNQGEYNYLLIFDDMYNKAILGNAQAQFHLGQMFQYGLGVSQNDFMAITFYKKAAAQQHLPAQYEMALLELKKSDDPESYLTGVKYLRDAAFKGNAYAEYVMSKLLQDNSSGRYIVKTDNQQALSMLYLAAANGFGQAQYELAEKLMHQQRPDLSVAERKQLRLKLRKLFKSAAKKGVADALLPLAFYNAMSENPTEQQKAFEIARAQAELGNDKAALLLGLLYDRGIGVQANAKEAMRWYQQSDKLAMSQFILATYMSEGRHIAQDKSEAVKLLVRASHAGFSYADYNLAVLDKQAGENFMPRLIRAYDEGNSRAGLLLADYTLASVNNPQAFNQAYDIYQGLAQKGDSQAQMKLGYMFEKGIGLATNVNEAMTWYKKSAIQGNPYAEYQLAMLYQTGLSSKPNNSRAIYWYKKAADQLPQAALALGFIYDTAVDNYPQAFKYYQAAASAKNASAEYNLGLMYQYGKGRPSDLKMARQHYKVAAAAGIPAAMAELAGLDLGNQGASVDLSAATAGYKKAASFGNSSALYHLGLLYESGLGVDMDYQKAINYYQQAVSKGNEKAMIALARLYQYGIGMQKNDEEAMALYRQLAQRDNAYAQYQLAKYYLNSSDAAVQSQGKALLQKAKDNGNAQAALYLRGLTAKTERKFSYIEPAMMNSAPAMPGVEAQRMYLEALVEWNRGDETLSRMILKRLINDHPKYQPALRVYKQINSLG